MEKKELKEINVAPEETPNIEGLIPLKVLDDIFSKIREMVASIEKDEKKWKI